VCEIYLVGCHTGDDTSEQSDQSDQYDQSDLSG